MHKAYYEDADACDADDGDDHVAYDGDAYDYVAWHDFFSSRACTHTRKLACMCVRCNVMESNGMERSVLQRSVIVYAMCVIYLLRVTYAFLGTMMYGV